MLFSLVIHTFVLCLAKTTLTTIMKQITSHLANEYYISKKKIQDVPFKRKLMLLRVETK